MQDGRVEEISDALDAWSRRFAARVITRAWHGTEDLLGKRIEPVRLEDLVDELLARPEAGVLRGAGWDVATHALCDLMALQRTGLGPRPMERHPELEVPAVVSLFRERSDPLVAPFRHLRFLRTEVTLRSPQRHQQLLRQARQAWQEVLFYRDPEVDEGQSAIVSAVRCAADDGGPGRYVATESLSDGGAVELVANPLPAQRRWRIRARLLQSLGQGEVQILVRYASPSGLLVRRVALGPTLEVVPWEVPWVAPGPASPPRLDLIGVWQGEARDD